MGDKLLAQFEAEAEEEMSKYVSYDGPAEQELVAFARKGVIAGLKEAQQIVDDLAQAQRRRESLGEGELAHLDAMSIITARINDLENGNGG